MVAQFLDLPAEVLVLILAQLPLNQLICLHQWEFFPCERCTLNPRNAAIPQTCKDLSRIVASEELWKLFVGLFHAAPLALQQEPPTLHFGGFYVENDCHPGRDVSITAFNEASRLVVNELPEIGGHNLTWKELYLRLRRTTFPYLLDEGGDNAESERSWLVNRKSGTVVCTAENLGENMAIKSKRPFDLLGYGYPSEIICLRPFQVAPNDIRYKVTFTNVHYYEISIDGPPGALDVDGETPCICIGLSFKPTQKDFDNQPGWLESSYGWHSDDGKLFHADPNHGEETNVRFGVGDTVGCGIRWDRMGRQIFFTKNGEFILLAFPRGTRESTKSVPYEPKFFPIVGVDSYRIEFGVNFGRTPFMYNLDSVNRDIIERQNATNTG